MAWLSVKPYTMHRDWNDIDKAEGRFASMNYVVADGTPYDLTHRVQWAQPVATGNLGAPLDPYQEYTAIKNMGSDPVLLYHNTNSNWPNDPFSRVILPGHWIEVVDIDTNTQPRIWVDSALYSSPMECEILQIGYQSWEEEEPDIYCDAWAVGHINADGCGTKHYPEAGVWATVVNTITDVDHWFADVAGVAVDDYWMVGYETQQDWPAAGLLVACDGTTFTEDDVESDPPFYGCLGFETDDFWAVGGMPAGVWEIWHWNGVSWTQNCAGVEDNRTLYCVHGSITNHVYAAGLEGNIQEWNGVVWTPHIPNPEMIETHFYGTWTSMTPNTWVCGGTAPWLGAPGGTGSIFVEAPPMSGMWQSYPLPPNTPTLRAMWGFGDGDIWAVGDSRTILRYNGFAWMPIPDPPDLVGDYDYRGVFGCYPWSVWAIGTDSAGGDDNVIIHWDGLAWSVVHGPNVQEMILLGLKGVEVIP